MDLVVNADKQDYSGTFNVRFKDKENREFISEAKFAFSVEA